MEPELQPGVGGVAHACVPPGLELVLDCLPGAEVPGYMPGPLRGTNRWRGGSLNFGAVLGVVSVFLDEKGCRYALIGGVAEAAWAFLRQHKLLCRNISFSAAK